MKLSVVLLEDKDLPKDETAGHGCNLRPDHTLLFTIGTLEGQLSAAVEALRELDTECHLLIVSAHGEPYANGTLHVGPAANREVLSWRSVDMPFERFPQNFVVLLNCCCAGFPLIQTWHKWRAEPRPFLIGPIVEVKITDFNRRFQEKLVAMLSDGSIPDYRTHLKSFIDAYNDRFTQTYNDTPVRYIDEAGGVVPAFGKDREGRLRLRCAAKKESLGTGRFFALVGYGSVAESVVPQGPYLAPRLVDLSGPDIVRTESVDARFVLLEYQGKQYWCERVAFKMAQGQVSSFYTFLKPEDDMPGLIFPAVDI